VASSSVPYDEHDFLVNTFTLGGLKNVVNNFVGLGEAGAGWYVMQVAGCELRVFPDNGLAWSRIVSIYSRLAVRQYGLLTYAGDKLF
jgi:hypothetical protein